ncbi:hypothetical protein ACOSQ4_009261 [Xanthoceras sorbifolium]
MLDFCSLFIFLVECMIFDYRESDCKWPRYIYLEDHAVVYSRDSLEHFVVIQILQSRSILQTHSGIGQETDLTALYLEPFHDCIAECLPSLLLKRKYSRSIY